MRTGALSNEARIHDLVLSATSVPSHQGPSLEMGAQLWRISSKSEPCELSKGLVWGLEEMVVRKEV